MKKNIFLLGIFFCLITCSCSATPGSRNNAKKQIVMAMVLEDESITPDLILEKQIDRFNQTHADCEIVIQEYYRSDDIYEDGINRIQREISTGKGPDIINYGDGYSIADVTGRYTEDLYRFILDDKELQKDLFMNIIDTFAVNGALYAIPTSVQIQTCAGRKEELGDISDWDVSTMIDCFDKIGKKYPLGYNTKSAICTDILYASLDEFIDWKNGTNSFYSDEFKKILEFANRFDYEYNEDIGNKFCLKDEVVACVTIGGVFDTAIIEGELETSDVVYVGYPCNNGSGNIVMPHENTMAISMSSKNKAVAWDFIKQLLSEEFQADKNDKCTLSVRKSVVKKQLDEAKKVEYDGGSKVEKESFSVDYSNEMCPIYSITDKQERDLVNLIESVNRAGTVNDKVYSIILEETDAYFAGEKTVDEVIDIINNRISIYISEKGC